MTARVQSFAPIVSSTSRILILGSLPGIASLQAAGYYAHPRNAFWPIMQSVFDVDATAPYETRTASVLAAGLALWDVVGAGTRPGSLDADIVASSVEANDIVGLLGLYPGLRRICLNGGAAATLFRRHVAPRLPPQLIDTIDTRALPSTSPAHASLTLADKTIAWRTALLDPL